MSVDLTGRDRIVAAVDGEEVEVYNHVSVSTHHYVNSVNGHETFEPKISAGDMGGGPAPDYVTERIATWLYDEWMIDVEEHGIEVVDFDDSDVTVL